jgi:hypothetical protein
MSLAMNPHESSPLTVPTCLPSKLTCQTHWEGFVKVMPTSSGGCIMSDSISVVPDGRTRATELLEQHVERERHQGS